MKVTIDKRDVEITKDMNTDLIIDQDVKEGTEIVIDENNPAKITLYIPDAYELYPDFVGEGWSKEDIEKFAEKYSLTLEFKNKESAEPEGKIIEQARAAGSRIVEGTKLIIYVAGKPEVKINDNANTNTTTDSGSTTGDNNQ